MSLSIWTTVRTCGFAAETASLGSRLISVTTPSTGQRMVRVSICASILRICASLIVRSVRALSSSSGVARLARRVRRGAACAWPGASPRLARFRVRPASAAVSSRARTWPFFTRSPSSTSISAMHARLGGGDGDDFVGLGVAEDRRLGGAEDAPNMRNRNAERPMKQATRVCGLDSELHVQVSALDVHSACLSSSSQRSMRARARRWARSSGFDLALGAAEMAGDPAGSSPSRGVRARRAARPGAWRWRRSSSSERKTARCRAGPGGRCGR